MTKVRYLRIRFNQEMFPKAVPFFRAAVIEKTRRQSDLFHNHLKDQKVIYRYPLIQYKIIDRKAGIVCLDQGTDDIHYLLQERKLDLQIGRQQQLFEVEDVRLSNFQVQCWEAHFQYSLKHWMALNQQNFKRYEACTTEIERLQLLEKILTANILAFAKNIGWQVQEKIECRITRLKDQRFLPFKDNKVLTFSLHFTTNVSLPDYIGLGKGVALGFGTVKRFGNIIHHN